MIINEKTKLFRSLHKKNKPVVLLNIWNVESAKGLTHKNINLIPTGSYAMADYYGYEDGEKMPFKDILKYASEMNTEDNIVTIDIESGYASSLSELEENIKLLIQEGVSGINLEDKINGSNFIYSLKEQCARISCIRSACKKMNSDIFLNARTDMYFSGDIEKNNYNEKTLNQTLNRIKAYEKAGADGIFIPGLKNKEHIKIITNSTKLPINLMLDIKNDSINDYFKLDVARISFGPSLYFLYNESDENDIEKFCDIVLNNLNSYYENNQIELFKA